MNYSESAKLGGLAAAETQHLKRKKRIEEYNKNPKLCKLCRKKIEYDKKCNIFCSSNCSAKLNNFGKDRHAKNRKVKKSILQTNSVNVKKYEIKKCLLCNNAVNSYRAKFCCSNCSIEYKKQKIYDIIDNGNTDLPTRQYRNYLINKYGAKCMLCSWSKTNEKTGKCPITIDHINGNSDDNRLENLRLLCPNCHSLTPAYCGLNIGNGSKKSEKRRIKATQSLE